MRRLWSRARIPILILSQPFEFCVSFSLLVLGIRGIISSEDSTYSELLNDVLVRFLLHAWEFGIVTASACILGSFLAFPYAARRGEAAKAVNRGVEKIGLTLMATAAAAYATVVVMVVGGVESGFSVGVMGGIVAACILRMVALSRIDRVTLYHLRRANEELA